MQRLFRLSLLVLILCGFVLGEMKAQTVFLSGEEPAGSVRILVKDSIYIIDKQYNIRGTLIIEPGATVTFYPQGRLIIYPGGRVIADGMASTDYNARPQGYDPIGTPGGPTNPFGWSGYADVDYFLYRGGQNTIDIETENEPTVHPDKYRYIFYVLLNKSTRQIVNFMDPGNPSYPSDPNLAVIPFESAIMWVASRLETDPAKDINLNIRPWQRPNFGSAEVTPARIKFIGKPTQPQSREWGHIVVLPGARAAFFRNVSFENFRKDTTVDRFAYYISSDLPDLTAQQLSNLNRTMINLTNGGGGVITTFSTRTWLLDAEFNSNFARNRGGALQILQAPMGFPMDEFELGTYPSDKNPNVTDRDGNISTIIRNNPIPLIDMIDEAGTSEPISDYWRQGWDDGRLSLYLGRMRNLKFDQNKVRLSNFRLRQVGNLQFGEDDINNPAEYPQIYGDNAYGGAIYIAGANGEENRHIEVGFGINNSIMIGEGEVSFDDEDTFIATGNLAENYQSAASTYGARGGALYIGRYTSVIAAGDFSHNRTYTKFLQDEASGTNSGYYSMGGAIFHENTFGRLQVRGGPDRDLINNRTTFFQNQSGAGGAIFVDGNTDPMMSPTIGGSDATVNTRDYGFNIMFKENSATTWGGALFTKRQNAIHGAGGVEANSMIGYGENYAVAFLNNTAGYAGGAMYVGIPNTVTLPPQQRIVQIVRAIFEGNVCGQGIRNEYKPEIRGGGAIYSLNGDLNLVKGVEFRSNKVYNGNGGALCLVHPITSAKRFFLTDLDMPFFDSDGIVQDYSSYNDVFSTRNLSDIDETFPPDARMLTRFLDNSIEVDDEILASQSGSGTTQVGLGTLATTAALYGTNWLDNNTGYAVGYGGTIIKLTNGGQNWTPQNSMTSFRLNDIYFTNVNNGIAIGDRGFITRTTNGGSTWSQVSTSIGSRINDVFFIGSVNGYAACNDGYILKTVNGGASWSAMRPDFNNLNSIYFTSNDIGYSVGDRGLVLKTTNAGGSWLPISFPIPNNLYDIYFVNSTTGFIAAGSGTVVKTTDGGNSWLPVYLATDNELYSIYFISQNVGFVAGAFGEIWKTEDGGANWTKKEANVDEHLYSVFFSSASVGHIVGEFGLYLRSEDGGETWNAVRPANESLVDVTRYHQEIRLPENGVGLGGAIYLLDSATINRVGRQDSVKFNRVRLENNKSFTGAAIYSDNYDMKLIFNRSLIVGNEAFSTIGTNQNAIVGAVARDNNGDIIANEASSDLASAVIYGEIQGPLPSSMFSEAANSMYGNNARFLIRLPDAPNTKGILAGTTGIGYGGTDTLRGNYWGKTEANVDLVVDSDFDGVYGGPYDAVQETFFVAGDSETHLRFLFNETNDLRSQGPFERTYGYTYQPIPLRNADGDENTPYAETIPENLLFSGWVYDIHDKGTDVKTADYTHRRMSPIEDFAVGIPPVVERFTNNTMPSFGKYVKRWIRDPFVAEAKNDDGSLKYPIINTLQDEFRPDEFGNYYHPIGYPLYLEAMVDYEGGDFRSNHDPRYPNESVFFIINETTGDYIRANFKQVGEDAPYRDVFRARIELVPDSTNRNPNTLIRRTAESLLNLGTGNFLLQNLADDPYNEDRATLPGRKYDNNYQLLGKVSDLFLNRPGMPADNLVGSTTKAAYFAGERYAALPVDTGDMIRIISRTVLWREGPIAAYDDGVSFKVVRSTQPPVFTGNIVSLQKDTVVKIVPSDYPDKDRDTLKLTEFLNTILVTEDRTYPVDVGWYSAPDDPDIGYDDRGRDSIVTVTAVDTSHYYDPRSYLDPEIYSRLTYEWWPIYPPEEGRRLTRYNESGLYRWLMIDSIPANDLFDQSTQNPRDRAEGYLIFRGKPLNPYVVPGGEWVYVRASNYPPNARTLDSLKALNVDPDLISKFINLFPPYFHAERYDDINARFAQQDTIDVGFQHATKDYSFRIFVVDSTPRWLDEGYSETVTRRIDRQGTTENYVEYKGSEFPCGQTRYGEQIANLNLWGTTDEAKLRLKLDYSTDDEWEDEWARTNHYPLYNPNQKGGWDFRFGKTAYGFMNVALRMDDTTIIDSTIYDKDMDGEDDDVVIHQVRPDWMADKYLYKWDSDTETDPFGEYFTTWGQLNIRVPATEALDLLKPMKQVNGALNLDTVFTVVVNDGHGGINYKGVPVYVNVSPTILTETLPPAKEDFDYNPQLLDSSRMIKVYDPNFDQFQNFEIIYEDDNRTSIPRDPCFPESGVWDLTTITKTPKWHDSRNPSKWTGPFINAESGLLYGTPGIKDAPDNIMLTVLVTDEYGMTHLKSIPLQVDSTNHNPDIFSAPMITCVDLGGPYSDTILVSDLDLIRDEDKAKETLTFRVLPPAEGKVDVSPKTITGPQAKDTIKLVLSSAAFDLPRDPDGKVTIEIEVTDAAGNKDVIRFRLQLSDATNFVSRITITNNLGAWEYLDWGTAPRNASTGDGSDGDVIGKLDSNLCEFELPPLPPRDVFDARWDITSRQGTLRSIYPVATSIPGNFSIYKGVFQPGGISGQDGPAYPVIIEWDMSIIPQINDNTRNPAGSTWWLQDNVSRGGYWNVNMRNGVHTNLDPVAAVEINGNICKVTIKSVEYNGFYIVYDWTSPVEPPLAGLPTEYKINAVSPNPYTNGVADIYYGLPKAANTRIDIIDPLGNVVRTVFDGLQTAGYQSLRWDGRDMNGLEVVSGAYTVRLTAAGWLSAYPIAIIK